MTTDAFFGGSRCQACQPDLTAQGTVWFFWFPTLTNATVAEPLSRLSGICFTCFSSLYELVPKTKISIGQCFGTRAPIFDSDRLIQQQLISTAP